VLFIKIKFNQVTSKEIQTLCKETVKLYEKVGWNQDKITMTNLISVYQLSDLHKIKYDFSERKKYFQSELTFELFHQKYETWQEMNLTPVGVILP
jgi:hypothetical protein